MERAKNIIVPTKLSIKAALKKMDETAEKILLVADVRNRLLGTVTDGDIRRWILKGASLSRKVSCVMNRDPLTLSENYSKEDAKNLMISVEIECIPIVDQKRRILSVIRWPDLFEAGRQPSRGSLGLPVVIMAGGAGSRLSPFTNILPKPLIPIGDRPILELIMDRFIEFGCNNIYLSVHYKSSILKAYFKDSRRNYNIEYLDEDKPLGTIGSLHMLREKIKTTFIVSNCDILIDADYYDIVQSHKENKNDVTLVVSLKHYTIPYGICEIGNGGTLRKIEEKPEYDFLVNTGSYIMEPSVLKDIPVDKPYQATDLINDYIKRKKRIGVYPVSEKSWLDIGQWEEYQKSLRHFEGK